MGRYGRNNDGKRVRQRRTGKRLVDACAGCCHAVWVRPRLCATGGLSGDTGEADEGHALGINPAFRPEGSYFCDTPLPPAAPPTPNTPICYYVPARPDYWPLDAVVGVDFNPITPTDWTLALQFYPDCDACGCYRVAQQPTNVSRAALAWTFSPDTTADIDVDFTVVDGAGPATVEIQATGTLNPVISDGCGRVIFWMGDLTTTFNRGPVITTTSTWVVTAGDTSSVVDDGDPGGGDPGWIIAVHPLGRPDLPGIGLFTDAANSSCGGGTGVGQVAGGGSVTINGNTCPCDAPTKLYRMWLARWSCADGAWKTAKPELVWQRCLAGHTTYAWPDDSAAACQLVGGAIEKWFYMVEEVAGDCPATLPAYPGDFIDADYPAFPGFTPDCIGCPAAPRCLALYQAAWVTDHWELIDGPVGFGCRIDNPFHDWTTTDPLHCYKTIGVWADGTDTCISDGSCISATFTTPALPTDPPTDCATDNTCPENTNVPSQTFTATVTGFDTACEEGDEADTTTLALDNGPGGGTEFTASGHINTVGGDVGGTGSIVCLDGLWQYTQGPSVAGGGFNASFTAPAHPTDTRPPATGWTQTGGSCTLTLTLSL